MILGATRWGGKIRCGEPVPSRRPRAGTEFHEHMNARDVRRAIGPEVFDAYLKVTIVRNPWDREVSRYFWATRGDANPPPFDRWVRKMVTFR